MSSPVLSCMDWFAVESCGEILC